MIHDLVLPVHIAAGVAGLVLGPVAMRAAKRPGVHTRTGEAYHWILLAVALTALVLAALDFARIWWLALVAVFSYAWALLGYLAAKRRRPGWLQRHVIGQGGSYIALITALLTVNLGTANPLAWILPTLVGTPLIAYVTNQIATGRRPKSRRPKEVPDVQDNRQAQGPRSLRLAQRGRPRRGTRRRGRGRPSRLPG